MTLKKTAPLVSLSSRRFPIFWNSALLSFWSVTIFVSSRPTDAIPSAPVFNEEGHVDYYLPDGTWTHLFSGEKREGGRWYADDYDYFSLPLYVRENSLLPLGACKDRPDYDYCDGLELHLYEPRDGGSDHVVIPDTRGDPVLEAGFSCENGEVILTLSRTVPGLKLVIHSGADKRSILIDQSETRRFRYNL